VDDGYLYELISGDDNRAEVAVANLAALPASQEGEILEALQKLLLSTEVDTRWWATRSLAAISNPLVSSLLVRALSDENASVRQCAALGLRLHPNAQAVAALVAALADKDGLVARLASDALANAGEVAVPALLEVMQSGTQAARLGAVRALACIGDQRSIPALFDALDEDSALMEYWATEGLERMGVGMMFFPPD